MKIVVKNLLILMLIGLIPCGCDNDPASPEEGHTDAEGFVLENEAGTELYREFEGEIVTNNITLSVGDTLELAVHFLDHDGNEIEHEEPLLQSTAPTIAHESPLQSPPVAS